MCLCLIKDATILIKSKENEKNRWEKQICCFGLILAIFRKSLNDDLFITQFYFIIIYHEYHENDPHAISSRLRGHLPIFGNKNLDVHLRKKGIKRKKVYEFHFPLKIDLHYYFHVTWALLEDVEIFYNFDHIFLPYFFALFDPSKLVLPRWAKNLHNK